MYSGDSATASRGGAMPSSAILACMSGLDAHCRKYQAASGLSEYSEIASAQPITMGCEPPGPAGSGTMPVSSIRAPPSMTVGNSFEDWKDMAERPAR